MDWPANVVANPFFVMPYSEAIRVGASDGVLFAISARR